MVTAATVLPSQLEQDTPRGTRDVLCLVSLFKESFSGASQPPLLSH